MVVDTEQYVTSQFQGNGLYGPGDNQVPVSCTPWGTCSAVNLTPGSYGAPDWVKDVIGGSAWTLTNLFGKYRTDVNYGTGFEQYLPLLLLGGGAILVISMLKK